MLPQETPVTIHFSTPRCSLTASIRGRGVFGTRPDQGNRRASMKVKGCNPLPADRSHSGMRALASILPRFDVENLEPGILQ